MNAGDDWMDPAVAPLRLFLDSLSVAAEPQVAPALDAPERGEGLYIDGLDIALPFELDVHVGPTGTVDLASTAPTQYTRTSVMPVFHLLAIRVRSTPNHG